MVNPGCSEGLIIWSDTHELLVFLSDLVVHPAGFCVMHMIPMIEKYFCFYEIIQDYTQDY